MEKEIKNRTMGELRQTKEYYTHPVSYVKAKQENAIVRFRSKSELEEFIFRAVKKVLRVGKYKALPGLQNDVKEYVNRWYEM